MQMDDGCVKHCQITLHQYDCMIMYDWCMIVDYAYSFYVHVCIATECTAIQSDAMVIQRTAMLCHAISKHIKPCEYMLKKRHPNISQHISCIPMCLFPSSYEFFSLASTFICVWSSSLKHAPRWFASTGVIWGASRESLSIALLCTCRSPLDRETTEKPTKSTSIKNQ